MKNKFNKKDLEFYLPERIMRLPKKYVMECIFNEDIQKKWKPKFGDLMIGPTGNAFVISAVYPYHESIGGTMYFFGGGNYSRNGDGVMDSTYCYTANESGKYFHPIKGVIPNSFHSSIRKFRYVPYPY